MNISDIVGKLKVAVKDQTKAFSEVVETWAVDREVEAEATRLLGACDADKSRPEDGLKLAAYPSGAAVINADPRIQIALLRQLYRRPTSYQLLPSLLLTALFARNLPYTSADIESLLAIDIEVSRPHACWYNTSLDTILRHAQRCKNAGTDLTDRSRRLLLQIRGSDRADDRTMASRKIAAAISDLLGDASNRARPDAGEAWADIALADLDLMGAADRASWETLIFHAQTSNGSKPALAWAKKAASLVGQMSDAFAPVIERWLGAVDLPNYVMVEYTYGGETHSSPNATYTDRNVSILQGLAWCCAGHEEPAIIRALVRLTEGALKKLPGDGPWAARAAGAAVYVLGEMQSSESVASLSRLRMRVTNKPVLARIEKAISAQALRKGISRDELEDLAVPTFGLDAAGERTELLGDYTGMLKLASDGTVTLSWTGTGGKPIQSVPTAVKANFAEQLKALKTDADVMQKTMAAQRQRVEAFITGARTWTLANLRETYFDHPLLGNIARRLIWQFGSGDAAIAGIWSTDGFVASDGASIEPLSPDVTVSMWHPLNASIEQIERWRDYLEQHETRQPFKQAHREVYLLTDAERGTETYSNRFASHIVKQHQFAQLAAIRGWKNQLRLAVDAEYDPARIQLPAFRMTAEFWVEGAGDSINDVGTYLYLVTDQVRFYSTDAAATGPLRLDAVPPVVLSEVMRDVDLFVGVASVGNDPAWSDGGPEGRYRDYWHSYAFGELEGSAQSRAAAIAKLIPRLKIASQCSIDGRFLRVQGKHRAYKIHLGSGNILMEPNDQYLCIVKSPAAGGDVFLPFEGDSRLALILSKAFLLAEDTKITDPTILRQINHR